MLGAFEEAQIESLSSTTGSEEPLAYKQDSMSLGGPLGGISAELEIQATGWFTGYDDLTEEE